jgi:HSP20 family molecular chaperone IbpA
MMIYDALFWLSCPDDLSAGASPWAFDVDGTWRETDDAFHLERRVPGFRKKDISVEVRGRVLEVRGERERGILDRERRAFRDVFTLPQGADARDVTADMHRDELCIRVGKEPHARRRTIPVRVRGAKPEAPRASTSAALDRPSWMSGEILRRALDWVRSLARRARAWM